MAIKMIMIIIIIIMIPIIMTVMINTTTVALITVNEYRFSSCPFIRVAD